MISSQNNVWKYGTKGHEQVSCSMNILSFSWLFSNSSKNTVVRNLCKSKNVKAQSGEFLCRNIDLSNFDNQWWSLYSKSFQYSLSCNYFEFITKRMIQIPMFFFRSFQYSFSCNYFEFLTKRIIQMPMFFLEKATNHTAYRAKWKLIINFFSGLQRVRTSPDCGWSCWPYILRSCLLCWKR